MSKTAETLIKDYYNLNDLDRSDITKILIFRTYVKRYKLTEQQTKDFFLYFNQLHMTRMEAIESCLL